MEITITFQDEDIEKFMERLNEAMKGNPEILRQMMSITDKVAANVGKNIALRSGKRRQRDAGIPK